MDYITDIQGLINYVDSKVPHYRKVGKVDQAVFREYEEAKGKHLKQLFGGEMIISKDIYVKTEPKDFLYLDEMYRRKAKEIANFLLDIALRNKLVRKEKLIYKHVAEEQLFYFDIEQYLLERKPVEKTQITHKEKTYTLQKGLSIAKMLSKFEDIFKDDMTDEFQELVKEFLNIRSEKIQKGNVEGKMSLSIDPRDFMTLSMNKSNWTSCYDLVTGDRPVANSAFMQSPNTFVAYLSSKDMELGEFKWNSKQWRVLIHFDGKQGFIGKEYPYESAPLRLELIKMLSDLMPDMNFFPDDGSYIIETFSDWVFDDISQSDFDPKVLISKERKSVYRFNLTSSNKCFSCGEDMDGMEKDYEYGLLTCSGCSDSGFCYDCNSYTYGKGIETTVCDECNENYYTEDDEYEYEDDE